MSGKLFQCDKISFAYPEGKNIFFNLDLHIYKGDLVIIRGGSGSGKSTFLKLLNRFYDTDEGCIYYASRELSSYGINELRKAVVYLPQLPVIIDGSIEENIRFPFRFHIHKDKKFDRAQMQLWLDRFHLDLTPDQDALKLSVGQQQRIALIRALLLEPEVLLLDEPVSSLDSRNREIIEQQIQFLASSSITVIMATHSDVSFRSGSYRDLILEDRKILERKGM